ncbi:MAG: NADH-quinone oxidoreductase subunit H [Cytophagales bacterium]|nr:MAG: NADH-quinone oxidoreductase subunit H [Cytophagales bacterium]
MIALLIILPSILLFVVIGVWAERKISAFVQDRYGPMEIGYYGIFQTIADLLKMLQKEDILPTKADKPLFLIAPIIIFTSIFAGYAVLPISPDIIGSSAKVGVFYMLTIISLDVVGLLMAGWGSNNKFAIIGAIRAVAQIISYEIPLTLSVLSVVMICQTLDLQEISYQQGIWINWNATSNLEANYLFGIKALNIDTTQIGGIFTWNIFRFPLLMVSFIIFFIASLAEANRAPFDLPEAESELVGGYHTEYSGFRWGLFMLAEYAMMLLVAFMGAILFLGSWNTPFPNIGSLALANWTSGSPGTFLGNIVGFSWLLIKTLLIVYLQMLIRWTYPRLRVDQLMHLCWKILTPIALGIVFIASIWRLMMI